MNTQQVSMLNRDGHTLRGIVSLPDTEGPVPCLLLLHGFTGSVSGYKYLNTRIARDLAEKGIGCVRFDFYGCGESDGEFQELSFSGLCRDAEDMFRWMALQDFADSERLCLGGQSLGGYVAASAAPKLKPAALVLLCPGGGMWYGARPNADAVKASGRDYVDMEGLCYKIAFNYDMAAHPDPYTEAKGYEGPVLIMRAEDDKLVDEASVRYYASSYVGPQLITLESGGHNFASIPARSAVTKAICEFIHNI